MIKSLLGADEPIEKEKTKSDDNADTSLTAPFQRAESANVSAGNTESLKPEAMELEPSAEVEPFEITDPIGKPPLPVDGEQDAPANQAVVGLDLRGSGTVNTVENSAPSQGIVQDGLRNELPDGGDKISVSPKTFTPDSVDETIRKTGLAWSAAIVLFASVAFMMLFGWFADFVFGTKPWGIVVGIVVGATIGFVQFFRTTSQILRPPKSEINTIPVYSRVDDDEID